METNFQLLMLSSNLLKAQIPMSGGVGGGGGCGNQFSIYDAESKFAFKKNCFCKNFSKFSGKKHNGFVLDFEYQVVPSGSPIRSIGEPQKIAQCERVLTTKYQRSYITSNRHKYLFVIQIKLATSSGDIRSKIVFPFAFAWSVWTTPV